MPYQHLTLEERSMMAPMRILGWSIRDIATQLGRAPSTISRELRRNSDGTGAYAGYWAHRDAQRRRRAVRHSCLTSGVLATYVQEKLQCRWSPEQIAHRVGSTIPTRLQCGSAIKRSIRAWQRITVRAVPGPGTFATIVGVGNAMVVGRVLRASEDECLWQTDRPSPTAEGVWETGKGIWWSVEARAASWPHMWTGAVAFSLRRRCHAGLPRRSRPSREKSCSRSRGR